MGTEYDDHIKTLYSLKDKTVLISGGAGFLGFQFALAICEAGAKCILIDICETSLQKAQKNLELKGYDSSNYCLSISDEEALDLAIKSIIKKHKHVDVLINSAALAMKDMQSGEASYFDPVETYQKSLWENALDINLTGTFMLCQRVGKYMKDCGRGSIINIASDVAVISPDHRIYEKNEITGYKGSDFNTPLSYCVSKTGILGMTRYLATYWAKFGIRVNSISPAGVYRDQPADFVKELSYRIPLGRMATASELRAQLFF